MSKEFDSKTMELNSKLITNHTPMVILQKKKVFDFRPAYNKTFIAVRCNIRFNREDVKTITEMMYLSHQCVIIPSKFIKH